MRREFCRQNRIAAFVAVVCMLLLATPPARAASFVVTGRSDAASARLDLAFPEAITCISSTPNSDELLLECDRPIDPPPTDDLLAHMRDWISWISNGYDTLLIHAPRDMKFDVMPAAPDRISIELTPVDSKPAVEDSTLVRGTLLRSQLLAAMGDSAGAAALLRQVLRTQPQNGQALEALADLELKANRWRRALDLYSKAIVQEPRNEDLISTRRNIVNEHAPVISYQTVLKNVSGGWTELLSSATGDLRLSGATKAQFHIDENYFRPFDQGAEAQFRSRTEASVQHDFLNGSALQAGVLESGRQLGTRISYTTGEASGKTHFEAVYGKPFWDLLASLEGNGVRDRISAGREEHFGTRTTLQLNVAMNRYRLDGVILSRTYGITGVANYTIRRQFPTVELNYVMDLERRTDRLSSPSFPLSNRDVHAMGSSIGMPIGRRAELLASAGMSIDIDGGQGPFVEAHFKRHLTERFSFEVWGEQRQNSVLTGSVVRSLGAALTVSFPRKESP